MYKLNWSDILLIVKNTENKSITTYLKYFINLFFQLIFVDFNKVSIENKPHFYGIYHAKSKNICIGFKIFEDKSG